MADVKWIKIVTDIFDNRKIRQIEAMPEGDSILVIWFKLICLAGKTNDMGMIYFTRDIPYTDEMLATQFNRPLPTVRLALKTFQAFGMVEIVDNFLQLPSWEKYQSEDKLERIRSKNAERQARFKARKRAALSAGNVTEPLPVTPGNAVEEDKEKEKDKEGDKEEDREKEKEEKESQADKPPASPRSPIPYESIRSLYNETCVSLSQCKIMSESRKKAIKARYSSGCTLEDFETLFKKAEASSFLKGKNDRNWMATFDWLIKDANMTKVLEGNYDDRGKGGDKNGTGEEHSPDGKHYGTYM